MDRFEDEIELIKYFRVIRSQRDRKLIDIDTALETFVSEGYAEKYSNVWYDGISQNELKDKLFG